MWLINLNRIEDVGRGRYEEQLDDRCMSTNEESNDQSLEEEKNCIVVEVHSLYCKFYTSMGDDELHNLNNCLERERSLGQSCNIYNTHSCNI